MKLSSFDIEFFELALTLKQPLTDSNIDTLKKTLLKLNNPTYYNKFTTAHPAHEHGYLLKSNINPILKAVSAMISIIKNEDTIENKLVSLQKEYSWAFNYYNWLSNLQSNSNK